MKFILIAVLAVFLTACNTTQVRIVNQTEYKLMQVDEVYLQDCLREAPPSIAAYQKMSPEEREAALTEVLIKQEKNLQRCNESKRKAREQQALQKKRIDELNLAEQARVLREKERVEK